MTEREQKVFNMRGDFETIEQYKSASIKGIIHPIMESGLRNAILVNHEKAILRILEFAEKNFLVLTVDTQSLQGLIEPLNYKMMKTVVAGRVYLRRKFLKGEFEASQSIQLSDFIQEAYKAENYDP